MIGHVSNRAIRTLRVDEIDVDLSNFATCVGCRCTDRQACPGGCSWLAVDRVTRKGVCSNCRPQLRQWQAQRAAA